MLFMRGVVVKTFLAPLQLPLACSRDSDVVPTLEVTAIVEALCEHLWYSQSCPTQSW